MINPIQKTKLYDYNAIYYGFPLEKLMENAGRAVAREIKKKYKSGKKIAIICGPGNNGGDGLVAARHLTRDYDVEVFLIPEENKIKSKLTEKNWKHVKTTKSDGALATNIKAKYDIVVDAMFGAGVSGKLKEPHASIVKKINKLKAKKISIDLPTPGFKADLILSLMTPKDPKAITLDIGYPVWLKGKIGVGEVKILNTPTSASRKGDNGKILIIAGNEKYHGALLLSAKIASKIVDLVYINSTQENNKIIHKLKPKLAEFITCEKHELKECTKNVNSILIGPGLGVNDKHKKTVNSFLKKYKTKKIVLDADALKMIDKSLLHSNCLLTPHKQEFKNLFGVAGNKANIKKMAQKYNCTILLKGKKDIVSNGEEVKINETGNPGMTKGGTGDVLAGLATALASQNDIFLSACAATFLNGLAGDRLYKKVGVYYSASDLVKELPRALSEAQNSKL